jgi:hypothetical protein
MFDSGTGVLVDGEASVVQEKLRTINANDSGFVELKNSTGESVFVKPDHVAGVRPR